MDLPVFCTVCLRTIWQSGWLSLTNALWCDSLITANPACYNSKWQAVGGL